jgi:hypothetical protein
VDLLTEPLEVVADDPRPSEDVDGRTEAQPRDHAVEERDQALLRALIARGREGDCAAHAFEVSSLT